MNRFGLTFAVPRGALLSQTLDALEAIGVDRLHAALAGEEQ